jgi:hypothetical protein
VIGRTVALKSQFNIIECESNTMMLHSDEMRTNASMPVKCLDKRLIHRVLQIQLYYSCLDFPMSLNALDKNNELS